MSWTISYVRFCCIEITILKIHYAEVEVQIWLHWGYQASHSAIIHCASCFHNTLVYVCLSKSCLKFWIYFCSPLQWMMTYIGSSGWGSSNLSDPRCKMRSKCCWARNCPRRHKILSKTSAHTSSMMIHHSSNLKIFFLTRSCPKMNC